MTLNSLSEVEAELAKYVPAVKELLGKDLTLGRMEPLMARLGNPETKLPIVHIAGTSGKTSTAYYLAALLRTTGKNIGLTVSPYVSKITERVQINGSPMEEADFCQALDDFLDRIKNVVPRPTYFELLIAFAYWVFSTRHLDYAVIETGLGGLHDATNLANSPDKVCVLTDIGLDHIKVLGSTLPEIAAQKVGIVYPGNQVFTFAQSHEVMAVYERHCQKVGAVLNVVNESLPKNIVLNKSLPVFQRRNLTLAYHAYKHIIASTNWPQATTAELAMTAQTFIPGRLEKHRISDKLLILDGAHNVQKISAMLNAIQALSDQKPAFLVALKSDKDYRKVLDLLMPVAERLIFTKFTGHQDLMFQSINPKDLVSYCSDQGFTNVISEPDPKKAYATLLRCQEHLLVVTGSFYLVSNIKEIAGL